MGVKQVKLMLSCVFFFVCDEKLLLVSVLTGMKAKKKLAEMKGYISSKGDYAGDGNWNRKESSYFLVVIAHIILLGSKVLTYYVGRYIV
jgi:hypothetical protein